MRRSQKAFKMKRGKIPLVPYIPLVDPILDAVESKPGNKNFKVSLLDGAIVYHAVYNSGSNKACMIHVQKIKGFYKSYEKAKTNFKDCTSRGPKLWNHKSEQHPGLIYKVK